MPHSYASDQDRILQNVAVDAAGCWNWQRYVHCTEGYGYSTANGQRVLAHRLSYEVFVGPIPAGLQIDHLCRNRACVNPDHLEAVTGEENLRRAPWQLGLANRAKTHCARGHKYSPENTRVISTRGGRVCRACERINSAAYKARRKAAR